MEGVAPMPPVNPDANADLLGIAMASAARGWLIFPLAPRSKKPLHDSHGFKDATSDLAQIAVWWAACPDANIGIATGAASGFFVLDVDPRAGGDRSLDELERRHGELPVTVNVGTGGGGTHYYFLMPDFDLRNSSGKLAAGLDIKANGGYVVGAGSVHPDGGSYDYLAGRGPTEIALAAAPPWLIEELLAGSARSTVDGRATEVIPVGQRNDALTSFAGRLRRAGAGYQALLAALREENATRCEEPLPDSELDSIALSVSRYEPHVGMRKARPSEAAGADLPEIIVTNRQHRDVVQDALDALAAANRDQPRDFVRDGRLVRVVHDEHGAPIIRLHDLGSLRARLSRVAQWRGYDAKGGTRERAIPREVVESILAAGEWSLPALAGLMRRPFLRPDGSICAERGYDQVTRICLAPPPGATLPIIPVHPSESDVRAAVTLIADDLLGDFPFEDAASKANTIGLLVTLVTRQAIEGQVPIAVIDKPAPGTGAGLLTDIVTLLGCGAEAAKASAPRNEEEWAKTLLALLTEGFPCIVFDNLDHQLRSASLAMALTSGTLQGRILGKTEMARAEMRAVIIVNGNNVRLGGDMPRRCYWIRMDARRARPWERDTAEFRHKDLLGWARQHESDLLGALLTIARAWFLAGQTPGEMGLGSFESWARMVGGMLRTAGIGGFLGNQRALYEQVDDDAPAWEAFLLALRQRFGTRSFKAGEVAKLAAEKDDELRELLPAPLDPDEKAGRLSRMLGAQLSRRRGMRYGTSEVHVAEGTPDGKAGVKRWRIAGGEAGFGGVTFDPKPGDSEAINA